jgi:hypothetical protein
VNSPETIKAGEADTIQTIGFLGSGEEVFVSPESHYYTHPDTHRALELALSKIDASTLLVDKDGITHLGVETEGIAGRSICVPITEGDKLVFAKRQPRTWYTRFVVGGKEIETNLMTIVLKRQADKFELYTAYWGPCAKREPSDPSLTPGTPEYEESAMFWDRRALILPTDKASMIALGINPAEIKESLDEGEEYFRS